MTVLASGDYHYWLNGEQQPVTEPWQIEQAATGWYLRGERRLDGEALMNIEADYSGLVCTGMRLDWRQGKKRSLDYRVMGRELLWQEDETQQLALPEGSLLYPLLRAATGPIIQLLAESPRTLVLPNLRNPADEQGFLRPLLSERRSECVDKDSQHYRYCGGEYGNAGSDYWLNSEGLVERYRWKSAQGLWDVRLENYLKRTDFSLPE